MPTFKVTLAKDVYMDGPRGPNGQPIIEQRVSIVEGNFSRVVEGQLTIGHSWFAAGAWVSCEVMPSPKPEPVDCRSLLNNLAVMEQAELGVQKACTVAYDKHLTPKQAVDAGFKAGMKFAVEQMQQPLAPMS